MSNFWNSIKPIFEQSWWQGFAGIAQFIAAILTIVSIRQAKKMFELAKKERKESVEPTWDIVKEKINTKLSSQDDYYNLEGKISLVNSGYGPARNFKINFEPSNEYNPIKINRSNEDVIFPRDEIEIYFNWNIKRPPIGILTLECITRLGHKSVKKLNIETFFDENHLNFGKWNLSWKTNEDSSNKLKRIYLKLKNIFNRNEVNKEKSEIEKKIKSYYQMEKWLKNNFEVQDDHGQSRGRIIVDRKERTQKDGSKVVTRTGISVHKFVSMFGLIDVPPTAADLQKNILDDKNQYIWNKRIKKWLDEGLIKKGDNYKEKNYNELTDEDFRRAVEFSLEKMNYKDVDSISHHKLVDNVREYFNQNNINYGTFSFYDVEPYLKEVIE